MDAIIQARTSSTRFPNKIFQPLKNYPLLWHVVNRLKYSKTIERIIIATTTNPSDNQIEQFCNSGNILVFRGDEQNVLSRYYEAAKSFQSKNIIRITADDPFKDPELIDKLVHIYNKKQLDFAYNNKPPTFPEGLDVEIFSFNILEQAFLNSQDKFEQEHVTQYFFRRPQLFKKQNFANDIDLSYLRWTIDTPEDYQMAAMVYDNLFVESSIFLTNDILDLLKQKPEIALINNNVTRSTMYKTTNR